MTTRSELYGVVSVTGPGADILAGEMDVVSEAITLAAGTGTLARGTVLGKLTKSSAVAAKVSGTGNGDVAAAAVTLGPLARPGVYTLTCTATGTNVGTFQVQTPDGTLLPPLTVAAAYTSDHINLTVPDGSTDWGAGAVITVTVTGTGHYAPYDATPSAYDGREIASRILADDITLDSTNQTAAAAYRTGQFRRAGLTGIDDAAVAALDLLNIFVR